MFQYSLVVVLYHVPVFIEFFASTQTKEPALSLSRGTWLIVAIGLSSLLLASLVGHLRRVFPASSGHGRHSDRHDYSYVPLTDINSSVGAGKVSPPRNAGVDLEDSDSQDEIWSPRSGGS